MRTLRKKGLMAARLVKGGEKKERDHSASETSHVVAPLLKKVPYLIKKKRKRGGSGGAATTI